MVGKLPSTGTGDGDDGLGIIGTAALGAAAAYLVGKTLPQEAVPADGE
jgi:LPXTG-motif cell wall-anchored protein